MIKCDVENSIKVYIKTKELPEPDMFGIFKYNTCDPFTGSWYEHLIDFDKLAAYAESLGYIVKVLYQGNREASQTVQFVLKYKGD